MKLPCAGFVLAGGRSTRMGTDKALLLLEGETLIERGVRQMGEVCAEVAIAGGAPELARYGRLVADGTPGRGPLGGLVAALAQSAYEWNAFVPVDVPFVPASVWRQLFAQADGSTAVAALVTVDGREQPLCGLYARAGLNSLRQSLEAGRLKITVALDLAGPVHRMPFDEAAWFFNVNTPKDYAVLQTGEAHLR